MLKYSLFQHALRREAARVFGWISDDSMVVDDDDDANQCDHQHGKGIACSCALALQIEQHGLFSTLHCRFVLDGERCSHSECPYSHSKLKCVSYMPKIELFLTLFIDTNDPSTPPHCIICGDFLGLCELFYPSLTSLQFCSVRFSVPKMHAARHQQLSPTCRGSALPARSGAYLALGCKR